MSRRAQIIRPTQLCLKLPEDVRVKLDLHLFSDVEGQVPRGAYQSFFLDRMREFFITKELDLAPYTNTPAKFLVVRGAPYVIETLKELLEKGAKYGLEP